MREMKPIKLKYIAELFNGNSIPDDQKDFYTNKSIPYIPTKEIDANTGKINYDNGLSVNEEDGFRIAPTKSILMCIEGGSAGKKIGITDRQVAFVNKLCCFNPSKIDSSLLYYCLQSKDFVDQFGLSMTGLIGGVSISALKNLCVTVPLESRIQKTIAARININCKKIDALIANQEAQIEKLKAYKQSLITEVVTKGLDKNVPMKNSGIEWIEKINARYYVTPIRSLFSIKKDIVGKEPETVLSITQNGLRVKDITENSGQMASSYSNYQIVDIGDFAMNHMDLLTGGVGISEYEGVTSPDYRVFTMKDKTMNPRYFLYVFQMYYRNKIFYAFGQGAANMGRWRLPAQNFNTISIPVAPIEEQNTIVEYLDKKVEEIEKLIQIKQQKIEKLNKYKKSLIYEYVTGKKEVI